MNKTGDEAVLTFFRKQISCRRQHLLFFGSEFPVGDSTYFFSEANFLSPTALTFFRKQISSLRQHLLFFGSKFPASDSAYFFSEAVFRPKMAGYQIKIGLSGSGFLAVEIECERLTLAVVVFDHDFERLSLGRECVVIEGEMSRRDSIAIVRREGFTTSADTQRPSAVVLEIAQRVARAFYDAFGSEHATDLDFFTRREGFRDGHRGDLERVNRSHVQTAITADQTKPGQEQDAYRPCRITDVRFHDSLGLEVNAETCRDGRSKEMYIRAEEEQSATADDKEQVIR